MPFAIEGRHPETREDRGPDGRAAEGTESKKLIASSIKEPQTLNPKP